MGSGFQTTRQGSARSENDDNDVGDDYEGVDGDGDNDHDNDGGVGDPASGVKEVF